VAGKARRARAVKRHRDLVWITTVFQASLLEGTGTDIAQILLASDWSSASVGFDRATLRSIRGWISFSQVAAGTAIDVPCCFAGLYICGQDSPANSFNPFDAGDYAIYDTLYNWVQGGEASTRAQPAVPVNVKVMRKLNSGQQVRLAATVPTDTATPRWNVSGIMRALVQLDPPG